MLCICRKHSVAEAGDLFTAFDDQVQNDNTLEDGLNVVNILKSWTEKGGYPVITVTANEETKKYHVSQVMLAKFSFNIL